MSTLAELFSRDPLTPSPSGAKGYTDDELHLIVEYYRKYRAEAALNTSTRIKKPSTKVTLEDLNLKLDL